MNLFKLPYLLLMAVFFCFAQVEAQMTPLQLKFDGRDWVLAYKNETDTSLISEFILKGETLNNWSEMVTIHAFWGPDAKTVEPYARGRQFIQELTQSVKDAHSKFISQTPDNTLFEWWTQGAHPEHEWVRVLKDPGHGYYIVRYTTKNSAQVAEQGKVWSKLLSEAKLEPKGVESISNAKLLKGQISGIQVTNVEQKFSIMQPEGWTKRTIEENGAENGYIFINPEKTAQLLLPFPWPSDSSEASYQDLKQEVTQRGGKLIKTIDFSTANGETVKGEVIGPVDLKNIRVNYLFFLLPGKQVSQVFLFSAKTDSFDEFVPLFKEIFRSYQPLEPVGAPQ